MRTYKTHKIQAFSLIELMVVIAITAVLSAIAIPSYLTSVQKSRRSDAINALLATQRAYELSYAQNSSYVSSAPALPSNTVYYSYSVASTATTYRLTATAGSAQASDAQGAIACNVLNIDNMNNRTPQDCWNTL